MSNFYKIEGENEFAYFKANYVQLKQIFESDPNWVAGVMEIAQAYAFTKAIQNFRNSLFGCKVEEEGNGFFEVRGTVNLYYRVEAVSESVSRIIPVPKLLTIHKILIPLQLAIVCLLPVVMTPLYYILTKKKIEWNSRLHLEPLCQYLQLQGHKLFAPTQKEVRQ